MKIVFMGTPEFAVPVLDAIHQSPDHEVRAVVTVPDKRGGRNRSRKLESAVKIYARENGIGVLQPEKLNFSGFLNELRTLKPDLIVVVAFRKLPKLVWSIPEKGTINLHASLLPAYRGAAPINHAIIAGEKTTGLTTFYIDEKIDTGKILLQTEISVDRKETAGSLYAKMMKISGAHMLDTLKAIEENAVVPEAQEEAAASEAPKVFFDQNELDFNRPTETLYNFIRGMSPYPGTWTRYEDKILKIYFAEPFREIHSNRPGEIDTDYKNYFRIYTADGFLEITDLQWEGKRRMTVRDFLNGLRNQ